MMVRDCWRCSCACARAATMRARRSSAARCRRACCCDQVSGTAMGLDRLCCCCCFSCSCCRWWATASVHSPSHSLSSQSQSQSLMAAMCMGNAAVSNPLDAGAAGKMLAAFLAEAVVVVLLAAVSGDMRDDDDTDSDARRDDRRRVLLPDDVCDGALHAGSASDSAAVEPSASDSLRASPLLVVELAVLLMQQAPGVTALQQPVPSTVNWGTNPTTTVVADDDTDAVDDVAVAAVRTESAVSAEETDSPYEHEHDDEQLVPGTLAARLLLADAAVMWVGMAAVAGMVAGCGVRIGEDGMLVLLLLLLLLLLLMGGST
ncbi:hypothetical protein BC831DRAFT_457760 [Entophlyctis helioformis]|nr:hypothetical protein BC831DRAFT_457760 [Entophlyctis helioformis]